MSGTTFTVERGDSGGTFLTFRDAAEAALAGEPVEGPLPVIREAWNGQDRVWYPVDPERGIWQATTPRGITTTTGG